MSADDLMYKLKQVPPKAWAAAAFSVVLVLVLIWQWWPEGAPKVDPAAQKAAEALKNDPAANPPVPDVPVSTGGGPRRKATKAN